jgi:hypothetical protein
MLGNRPDNRLPVVSGCPVSGILTGKMPYFIVNPLIIGLTNKKNLMVGLTHQSAMVHTVGSVQTRTTQHDRFFPAVIIYSIALWPRPVLRVDSMVQDPVPSLS